MANLPTPQITNQVIQNDTTGVVDFLQYRGNELIASSAHDYGLGSDWKIVASGRTVSGGPRELVAQSQSTGQLDFLQIDDTGTLVSSFMTSFGLPTVHGIGDFGGTRALVSQLDDGSLDFLQFDANHNFIASQLIQNTIGLTQLRGVAEGEDISSMFKSLDNGDDNSTLITQLADGTINAIGLSGSFGSLAFSGSSLLSQTVGSGEVRAVNQTNTSHESFSDENSGNQGPQFLTLLSDGSYNALYVDSGYGDDASEGAFYASSLTQGFAGWSLVDGGAIASRIFPLDIASA